MSELPQANAPSEDVDEKEDPNAWLENITCDLGLRQHLDAEIQAAQDDFKKSANPSWYPSDLGKDLFVRYIKRKGVEALPFNPRTLRKFEIGKLWEARLHQVVDARIAKGQGNIKEIDLNPEAQFPAMRKRVVNDKLELRGYYDRLLLVNQPNIGWVAVVYEIKSVASSSFHHQKKEGLQPLGNRLQMMFYLERIQAPENWEKLKRIAREKYQIELVKAVGVLSQVSKDDGSMWERTYEFDPVLYQQIEDEITLLNKHWQDGTPPPKPDILIFEGEGCRVNWEVSYSNYVHHIIGSNYKAVLQAAETLQRKHYYARKKNPSKLPSVIEAIKKFNETYK